MSTICCHCVRNEENGDATLTIKAKTTGGDGFFKRIELETVIEDVGEVIKMMPFLGFSKKISWEKRRYSFTNKNGTNMNVIFFLDETPIGWFLEIEGDENSIEDTMTKLGLQKTDKISKPYLALWDEYRHKHNIPQENMLFSEIEQQ